MKIKKSLTFVFLNVVLSLAVAQASDQALHCVSTNNKILVKFDSATRQTFYQMNPQLHQTLKNQGASLNYHGAGFANWDQGNFLFRTFNDEIRVFSDSGGIKVRFERDRVGSVNIQERAEFFFNPGECSFR